MATHRNFKPLKFSVSGFVVGLVFLFAAQVQGQLPKEVQGSVLRIDDEGRPQYFLIQEDADGFPIRKEINQRDGELAMMSQLGRVSSQEVDVELRSASGVELWPVENSWSLAWERKFAEFIERETDPYFYKKYGIRTDCADVAYGSRMIFARNNKLPIAFQLMGEGKRWFTNRSVRESWLKLPTSEVWHQDRRFMAALDYALEMTYTHTLSKDSYPVKITSENMQGGVFHLELGSYSGHSSTIWKVHRSRRAGRSVVKDFEFYASSVPRSLKDLAVYRIIEQARPRAGEGMLRFRWPVLTNEGWRHRPVAEQPDYSLEQYQDDFYQGYSGLKGEYMYALRRKLGAGNGGWSLQPLVYEVLESALHGRVKTVKQGFSVCQKESCKPGTPNWEFWSTPSRDRKILKQFAIAKEISRFVSEDQLPQFQQAATQRETNSLYIIESRTVSMASLRSIWESQRYDSDPRNAIMKRWGLARQATLHP